MRYKLLGFALIVHALAHAAAGMWATSMTSPALVTLLWGLATVSFLLAGGAILGWIDLFGKVRQVTAIGAFSSLGLLVLFMHRWFLPGIVIDAALLGLVILQGAEISARPSRRKLSRILYGAFVGYVAVLIGLRTWTFTWGATETERVMPLAGDPSIADPHYRIDHAITVNAPAESVWPWLVQIGQDRAGFYSYDWLERAFGDHVYNYDEIIPYWQRREVGDFVRGAQTDYLFGLAGPNVGWRITNLEPGRAMVLEGWGAFIVHPIDSTHSRLHIRSRGSGSPTLRGIALAPISLMTLEPAHFIMERRMLLGIKQRAEASVAGP